MSTLYCHLDIPVTCKMRILPSESDTLLLAATLQAHGAQVLTVHGRTRQSKQQMTGAPDWHVIRKIKYVITYAVHSAMTFRHIKLVFDKFWRGMVINDWLNLSAGSRCAFR